MSENKTVEVPKTGLAYAVFLLKTWWTLVPVGILSAFGIITGWVEKFGSPDEKTQWEGLLQGIGWSTVVIVALLTLILVLFERSHRFLQLQQEAIADLKTQIQNSGEWWKLFDRQRGLEQEIASLEMNMPAITTKPVNKIGKDLDDYAKEELDRKKNWLKQITDRLQKFS